MACVGVGRWWASFERRRCSSCACSSGCCGFLVGKWARRQCLDGRWWRNGAHTSIKACTGALCRWLVLERPGCCIRCSSKQWQAPCWNWLATKWWGSIWVPARAQMLVQATWQSHGRLEQDWVAGDWMVMVGTASAAAWALGCVIVCTGVS